MAGQGHSFQFKQVPEFHSVDQQVFADILRAGQPALIKNCHFGGCTSLWNLGYLREKLADETVVIHECQQPELDFLSKNFTYNSCPFSTLCDKLSDGRSNVYLRSVNRQPRSKQPAKIELDFPAIKDDLKPPSFIPYSSQPLYHSSVLRLASPGVQIWTHFDLYDNILVQVVGAKRVVLIPPVDSRCLYVEGDKSPVNNFTDFHQCLQKFPLVSEARLYQTTLRPADALFIPALWWHNIRTVEEQTSASQLSGYSIGFNIFWKDSSLDAACYAKTDVYGNRDLVAFESAAANLDRAVGHLERLPQKYRDFYSYRLLRTLEQKLARLSSNSGG